MNTTTHNVALLVHSCDRYAFLYKGFEYFFNRHWPLAIPCNYYFATEEKPARVKGFTNILSGKGEWANRLAYLLISQIKEEYILYLQEDMWLSEDVNEHFFTQLFALATESKWKQVKLHSSEVYKTTPTAYSIEGFVVSKVDNQASDYLMSHQVTLWDKQFLLQQLVKNEHPWRNERRGTKRLKRLNPDIYQIDYFAENGKPAINKNNNPVGRSSYYTVSVNGMLNINVTPFIKQLMNDEETGKAYALQLQHHYNNSLTHDGKPKPRKEGVFKKLKNRLRKND
jgi:hypothetical protein